MNIICKLDSELINNINIDKYHVIILHDKLLDIYHDNDLRFLKNKKNMINNILKETSGIIIKISSWDYLYLKHDYVMSNKIKHKNFIQHYCYFEYEDTIFNDNKYPYENSAIIFTPYYISIKTLNINDINKDCFYNCVKQIILALYLSYFNNNIQFKNIISDNIYFEYKNNNEKLKYKLKSKEYIIETNIVVKIDASIYSEMIIDIFPHHYKRLYDNIENILKRIPNIYNLDKTIDIIHDFNNNSDHIVHPLKSLDIILTSIY